MSDQKCAAMKALEDLTEVAEYLDTGGVGATKAFAKAEAALSAPCPLAEENRVLRRVAEAYRALEALEEKAKQEWIEAEETPQECLEWVADMEVADKEKNAALAEARAKGMILR